MIDDVEVCNDPPCMQIGQGVERAKPVGLLEPLPVPDRPWASISIDFNLRLRKVVELESGCGGQVLKVRYLHPRTIELLCTKSSPKFLFSDSKLFFLMNA